MAAAFAAELCARAAASTNANQGAVFKTAPLGNSTIRG